MICRCTGSGMRLYRSSIRWNGMFSATIRAVMSNSESGDRSTADPPADDDDDAPSAPPSLQHGRLLDTPAPRLQHGRLHDAIATTTAVTLRRYYDGGGRSYCRFFCCCRGGLCCCFCCCFCCWLQRRLRWRFGGHASHVRIQSGQDDGGGGESARRTEDYDEEFGGHADDTILGWRLLYRTRRGTRETKTGHAHALDDMATKKFKEKKNEIGKQREKNRDSYNSRRKKNFTDHDVHIARTHKSDTIRYDRHTYARRRRRIK